MDELIKVGEESHKNPAISNVVANTIAMMKKQRQSLSSGPFSHLFDTLHGEALLQSAESPKVDLPKGAAKTAVKTSETKLDNIAKAIKASVPKQKTMLQLQDNDGGDGPVDVNIKVRVNDGEEDQAAKEAELKKKEAELKKKEEEEK